MANDHKLTADNLRYLVHEYEAALQIVRPAPFLHQALVDYFMQNGLTEGEAFDKADAVFTKMHALRLRRDLEANAKAAKAGAK